MPWPEGFIPQLPWVDVETIIEAHARFPRPENEQPTVNRFALEAAVRGALQTVGGEDAYPTRLEKIAAMVLSINHRHCFGDGNKRASLVAAIACLKLNGLTLQDSPEIEKFFWRIGTGHENLRSVADWFEKMVLKDTEPERAFIPSVEGFFEK